MQEPPSNPPPVYGAPPSDASSPPPSYGAVAPPSYASAPPPSYPGGPGAGAPPPSYPGGPGAGAPPATPPPQYPGSNPYAYASLPPTSASAPSLYPPPQGGNAPPQYPPVASASYPQMGYGGAAPPPSTVGSPGVAPPNPYASPPPGGMAPPSTTMAPPPGGMAPPAYGQPPPVYPGGQPGMPGPYEYAHPSQAVYLDGKAPPPSTMVGPAVSVAVQMVTNYSPLSYGSSFVAYIRANRHHNKFVSLNEHFQIAFTDHPMTKWNFILSNSRDCYFIVAQWTGRPDRVLQLRVPPTPLFLRSFKTLGWAIHRAFGYTGPESAFFLEAHGGQFALRNQASMQYVSAEDHGLRANRKECKDWERFGIEVIRADQQMTLMTPFGPVAVQEGVPGYDLVLTYHVAFRAKIRSERLSQAAIGCHKGRIDFSNHDTVWEFLPSPHRNSYVIRNADHPDVYWNVTGKNNAAHCGSRHDVESEFLLEFKGRHYFFVSCATGRYGCAESSKIVFNRESGGGWEAFSIDVQHQLDFQ